MYTIYSLGDTWYLGKVMDAIAMVSGSDSSFVGASAIAAMVGVFMIMFQALLKGGQALSLQIFLVCYIFYMGCFHTTVDVAIEGVYSDQDVVQKDNIPAGPAILGSVISSVGHGLTEKMEQAFAAVDNPVILGANGGYLNSLYTINNLARLSESDKALRDLEGLGNPYLGENIRRYIAECTTKAVYVGKRYGGTTTSEMQTTTTDGLKHIIFNSEFYGTLYRDNNGNEQTLSCKEAGEKNALDFQSAVTALTSDTHKICEYANIMGFEKDMASCNAGDYLNNVSSAWEHLRQSHYTMQSLMAAGITRNLTHEGLAMGYRTYGNDLSATMIYQAIQQRNVQWTAEQSMFLNSVKPIMSFIEGFFYAISPFAGIMVWLGMMGLNIFFKYLIMLIWIQLWLPILSIANLFITTSASRALDALPKNSNGMSLQEYEELVSICQDRIAVGGMMMAATPVLSLMVITGSVYAFTQLTSRMQGADHINEKMVAPDAMQPSAYMATQSSFSADSQKSILTGASYMNFSVNDTLQRARSSAENDMLSKQNSLSTTFGEAYNRIFGTGKAFEESDAFSKATAFMDQNSISHGIAAVKSAAQEAGFTLNDSEAESLSMAIAGKTPLGKLFKIDKQTGAKTEHSYSEAAKMVKNTQDTQSRSAMATFQEQMSGSLAKTLKETDNSSEASNISRQLTEQAQDLSSSVQQYTETNSYSLSAGASAQANEADLFGSVTDSVAYNILNKATNGIDKSILDSTKRNIENGLNVKDLGKDSEKILTLRALRQINPKAADNAALELFEAAGLVTKDQREKLHDVIPTINNMQTHTPGSTGVDSGNVQMIRSASNRVQDSVQAVLTDKEIGDLSKKGANKSNAGFNQKGSEMEHQQHKAANKEMVDYLNNHFAGLDVPTQPYSGNDLITHISKQASLKTARKGITNVAKTQGHILDGKSVSDVYGQVRNQVTDRMSKMFDPAIEACKGLPQEKFLRDAKKYAIEAETRKEFDSQTTFRSSDTATKILKDNKDDLLNARLSLSENTMLMVKDLHKQGVTMGDGIKIKNVDDAVQNGYKMNAEDNYTTNVIKMVDDAVLSGDYTEVKKFATAVTPHFNARGLNMNNKGFYKR